MLFALVWYLEVGLGALYQITGALYQMRVYRGSKNSTSEVVGPKAK